MRYFLLAAVVILGGCSSNSAPSGDLGNEAIGDAKPSHNWTAREGDRYLYESALSENDKNEGRAAGKIVMYRYLGEKDGVHTVEMVDDDGAALGRVSCSNPCKILKMSATGGGSERMAFNENSLAGAVLTDAFNGNLEIAEGGPDKS